MKSILEIKAELQGVQYYYRRQDCIDQANKKIGVNVFMKTVEKYNELIRKAPLKLYDIYSSLYVDGLTREALANDMMCSPQYVHIMNGKLLEFFEVEFKKENF